MKWKSPYLKQSTQPLQNQTVKKSALLRKQKEILIQKSQEIINKILPKEDKKKELNNAVDKKIEKTTGSLVPKL